MISMAEHFILPNSMAIWGTLQTLRHSEIQTLRTVILLVIHSSHEYPIQSSFSTVKPPGLQIYKLKDSRHSSFS